MRVAGYDYADGRRLGFDVELREVVKHVHEHRAELHDLALPQGLGPRTLVVVASNCGYGRDCRELVQDVLAADVTSMDDVVAATQERTSLRPEETMSVGNEANA